MSILAKEIALTRGKVALVDEGDFERVNALRWCAVCIYGIWYAMAHIRIDDKKTTIGMHRFILNAPKHLDVDHWDGDGLNNRRTNLRPCTQTQNQRNRHRVNGQSRYKGVSWHKRDKAWQATIRIQSTLKHLGNFENEKEAAIAYDLAATEYFGEFAKTNKMLGLYDKLKVE